MNKYYTIEGQVYSLKQPLNLLLKIIIIVMLYSHSGFGHAPAENISISPPGKYSDYLLFAA